MHLAELGVPLARVLEAASDELGAAIAEALRAAGDKVVELLVPVLRAHRPPPTPPCVAIAHELPGPANRTRRPSGAGRGRLVDRLGRMRLQPVRSARGVPGARSERTHEWPLAKPGRQHVHQQIDAAGLPVRHITRRQGRPYTLLLAKTEDLFRREDELRRQARTDLDWLTTAFE